MRHKEVNQKGEFLWRLDPDGIKVEPWATKIWGEKNRA